MADSQSVPSNVYTVLTIVALIALLAGIVFVAMQSDKLFGTFNPMGAEPLSTLLPTRITGLLG